LRYATLATAFVIFTYIDKDIDRIRFSTKSGVLEVSREGNLLSLIFPSREGVRCEAPGSLVKGLGKKSIEV
jgi:hypothetical protein